MTSSRLSLAEQTFAAVQFGGSFVLAPAFAPCAAALGAARTFALLSAGGLVDHLDLDLSAGAAALTDRAPRVPLDGLLLHDAEHAVREHVYPEARREKQHEHGEHRGHEVEQHLLLR